MTRAPLYGLIPLGTVPGRTDTMARMSPTELAAKWAKNFGGSADRYRDGVNRVTDNPAQKAVQAKDRCLAGFTDAITSGKWEAGLNKVTLGSWKQAATEKGAPALATAARVATDKVMRAEQTMGPTRDGIKDSLPPRGTIDENLERARQMALKMHEARRKG